MNIAIIGSGAIGCLYGAYLSRNNNVYMLCRRRSAADAIERDGLTVFEPDGTVGRYCDVHGRVSGECEAAIDLAIVIVKGADTAAAIEANLNIIGENTMVMTLQNGGGNDLVLAEYVPMERVVVGTTRHNSVNLENGTVRHSGSGETCIGSNVAGVDLSPIVQAFQESGIETVVSDDIQRIIWSKLFLNLSVNTFTAITKGTIGSMAEDEHAWFFAEKMICEAIDVAEAEGLHFSYREVLNSVHAVCAAVSDGFSSMSQDVMSCRKTEVDAINGFVVRRAAVHNVPAPYNTFVVNLVHAIEATYEVQAKPMFRYSDGDVIVEQDRVQESLYQVMQGTVMLYLNRGQEDEYLIGAFSEGQCFGEYSCFTGNANPYSAVAMGDAVVMEIPRADIHNFIALNPKNAENMLEALSKQIALLAKHVELLNVEVLLED